MRVLVLSICSWNSFQLCATAASKVIVHKSWAIFKIWASIGLVGNTEKKLGPIISKFCCQFFSCFQGQKHIQLCFDLLDKETPHRMTYV